MAKKSANAEKRRSAYFEARAQARAYRRQSVDDVHCPVGDELKFTFAPVCVATSRVAGRGLFAAANIAQGTVLGVYSGKIKRLVRDDREDMRYVLKFGDGQFVVPNGTNLMQFVNEVPPNATANCFFESPDVALELQDRLVVPDDKKPAARRDAFVTYPSFIACRDIFEGEEIFTLYDNALGFNADDDPPSWRDYEVGKPCAPIFAKMFAL
tara:strand:- start:4674 stop:5306 length:633 start_codon:yes stop_codon:yes gene_type:complete